MYFYVSLYRLCLVRQGTAKVLQVFNLSGAKKSVVAGLSVQAGKLKSSGTNSGAGSLSCIYRVKREEEVVLEEFCGKSHLKRFKDTVNSVSR